MHAVDPNPTVKDAPSSTTISPVVLYSPDKVKSLLLTLTSSAKKPEYLVNVDTPRTSKFVDFIVPLTFKFPWPVVSVPIPTALSFMLKDPIPTRKVAMLYHLWYFNCINLRCYRCG